MQEFKKALEVPGFEEPDDEQIAQPNESDLPTVATDPGPSSGNQGSSGRLPIKYAVPAKVLRQMRAALVQAASGFSVGMGCVWTSRGTMAIGAGASIWMMDLSMQVCTTGILESTASSST